MAEKSKKRGQGEGTISKRPDGTWWARITVGKDAQGKQKRKAFYGKTRREVQEKLAAAASELSAGTYIEPSKMTVEQWLNIWIKEYKKPYVQLSSYVALKVHIENHIVPAIGAIQLKNLRNDHVQKMITILTAKEELGANTVARIFKTLRSALNKAVNNEIIAKNVAENAVLPKVNTKKVLKALTLDEQNRLVSALRLHDEGDRYEFMLYTGLRIGELTSLTWDDVDFNNSLIHVNKSQARYKEEDGRIWTSPHIGTTKTLTSIRDIPLIPEALEIVMKRKERLELEQSVYGFKNEFNLVFCNRKGNMLDRVNAAKTLRVIGKRAGIDYLHPHMLRHTFATRGMENGIDLKVMQVLMGHSNSKITAQVYTHVTEEFKTDSIMKLSAK